jgi:HK97 family phage prohead protease
MTVMDRVVRYGPVLECKAVDDGWRVEGFASDYEEDLQGDVVVPGAFTDSLARNPRPPLLFAHDQAKILGTPTELRETPAGLWGRWRISKTQLGADVRQLLLDKAVGGLSIGFFAGQTRPGKSGLRELHRVDLFEVSVVGIPANPRARVTGVKARPAPGYAARTARPATGLDLRFELTRRRLRRLGILDENFRVVPGASSGPAARAD